ncbi:MAG: hypothetical protein GY821_01540, partial [Gammaproteobacteria bacterium]|nr:hypothetical protein [Gammaproteobacteria bacterium]
MHRFKPTEDQTTDYVYLAGQLVAKLEHKPDPLEVAGDAVISSTGGTYINSTSVTMSTATVGGIIHYTTDGSIPTESSATYSGPITITSTTTFKAIVFGEGILPSNMASESYTIQSAAPAIRPNSGTYNANQTVRIETTTPGGVIRYTTNGTTPTNTSTEYSGPFTVSSAKTITARTFASGKSASGAVSTTYSFVATKPTISPNGGRY